MEKYLVSRELAEKLKAAGYPQNTQFGWDFDMDDNGNNDGYYVTEQVGNEKVGYLTAAPLSDELLEQIPDTYEVKKGITGSFVMRKFKGIYVVGYMWAGSRIVYASHSADKPADALAELWLYCKENNYV